MLQDLHKLQKQAKVKGEEVEYAWPRHDDPGRNVFEAEVLTIFDVAREKMNRSCLAPIKKKKRKPEHYMEPSEDRHPWLDSNGQNYETSMKLHVHRLTWRQCNVIFKQLNAFCPENNLNLTAPTLTIKCGKRGRLPARHEGCTWSRALRDWECLSKDDSIFKKFEADVHTTETKSTEENKANECSS